MSPNLRKVTCNLYSEKNDPDRMPGREAAATVVVSPIQFHPMWLVLSKMGYTKGLLRYRDHERILEALVRNTDYVQELLKNSPFQPLEPSPQPGSSHHGSTAIDKTKLMLSLAAC